MCHQAEQLHWAGWVDFEVVGQQMVLDFDLFVVVEVQSLVDCLQRVALVVGWSQGVRNRSSTYR